MKLKSQNLIALTIIGVMFWNPGFSAAADAQKSLSQQQIDAYNRGQYAQVIQIGDQILQSDGKDAKARYYMANALVKLNRVTEAMEQYAACEQLTADPAMKVLCKEALTQLPARQAQSAAGAGTQPAQNTSTNKAADQAKSDIWRQADQEIGFKKQQADHEIANINQHANFKISQIPQYILNLTGDQMIVNPDYMPLAQQIQNKAANDVQQIQERFQKEKADIMTNYGKKAAAWDEHAAGIASQQR